MSDYKPINEVKVIDAARQSKLSKTLPPLIQKAHTRWAWLQEQAVCLFRGYIKAIVLHHFGPRFDKVLRKLIFSIVRGIHLGDCT